MCFRAHLQGRQGTYSPASRGGGGPPAPVSQSHCHRHLAREVNGRAGGLLVVGDGTRSIFGRGGKFPRRESISSPLLDLERPLRGGTRAVPGVGPGGGNELGRWAGGVTSEPGITWSPPSIFSQLCRSHPQFSLRWTSPTTKHTLTEAYGSVVSRVSTKFGGHHHCLVPGHFHPPPKGAVHTKPSLPVPPQPLATSRPLFPRTRLSWTFPGNGTVRPGALRIWPPVFRGYRRRAWALPAGARGPGGSGAVESVTEGLWRRSGLCAAC